MKRVQNIKELWYQQINHYWISLFMICVVISDVVVYSYQANVKIINVSGMTIPYVYQKVER